MLCWWNTHYTFNDAHIWILDATYTSITKQAIDGRYIHCTNVASSSLRQRLNYRNSWSINSRCKAIIWDLSYTPLSFCLRSKQPSIDFWSYVHTVPCTSSWSKFKPIEFGSVIRVLPSWSRQIRLKDLKTPNFVLYFVLSVMTENISAWFYVCCAHVALSYWWSSVGFISTHGRLLISIDWFWIRRAYVPLWSWTIPTW